LNRLIVIAGPTASGKTALSIDIAKELGAEIFNADSRQFYRGLNIGTAKPTKEEQSLAKHHFIDTKNPNEEYSAGAFEKDCIEALGDYFQNSDTAILVGGSGLYIRAVLEGFDDLPKDKSIRDQIKTDLEAKGLHRLRDEVIRLDPEFSNPSDLSNPQRLIRALEVMTLTKQPYSKLKRGASKMRNFEAKCFALMPDRMELYNRINQRVVEMMDQGLLAEVKSLIDYRSSNALQTVGYREMFEHLDKEYDLDTTIKRIQQHTRNYAKRQITWFKNQGAFVDLKPPYFNHLKKHLNDHSIV
jgi:tRNA dimethylallyltransferase